jgi:hypothetical protein
LGHPRTGHPHPAGRQRPLRRTVLAALSAANGYETMADRVVFTFWEPRDRLVPYLALCRKTWEQNLPGYSIVVLDYANLENYLGRDVFDWTLLKRLSLPTQKDAISVAVMKERGGIFMDIDTLVFRDLDPILRRLDRTQLIMFGSHMAFFAARPNSLVPTLWLTRIQEKLLRLKDKDPGYEVPWDYVGNSTLSMVMDEIIDSASLNRLQTRAVRRLDQFVRTRTGWSPGLTGIVSRLCESFLRRRKHFAFRTVYRKYLTSLDRIQSRYMLETGANAKRPMDPERDYIKYWFESDLNLDAIRKLDPVVVGLHNSWTPRWYKELSERQVLENACPLSRTLGLILGTPRGEIYS